VEECLELGEKVREAENKEWELEYMKERCTWLETVASEALNVSFPAGDQNWFDGYVAGFKAAHSTHGNFDPAMFTEKEVSSVAETKDAEKNAKDKGKAMDDNNDSDFEWVVEESPGYASTAEPTDLEETQAGIASDDDGN